MEQVCNIYFILSFSCYFSWNSLFCSLFQASWEHRSLHLYHAQVCCSKKLDKKMAILIRVLIHSQLLNHSLENKVLIFFIGFRELSHLTCDLSQLSFCQLLSLQQQIFSPQLKISHMLNGTTPKIQHRK